MTMRQLYYTSCTNGTVSGTGFQVKALSPGIKPDEREVLNNILGYRIPPGLATDDVSSHPIALRYQYLDLERCILLCSQSNGPDDNGRPGNFFAHCVITSPEDFAIVAPVMYWGHSFWKRNDPSDQKDIDPQPSFDLEPSLDFDAVWPFLEYDERKALFERLLCAVIRHDEDHRPVVIVDSAENVAMWVAAVTFALPADFRQLISFTTYHHDPYQVPFLITGTTEDSRFRCSADEYLSYFILNTAVGRISDVQDSTYAAYVCKNMCMDRYEDHLLDFLAFCSTYLLKPSLSQFSSQLDWAATLHRVIRLREVPFKDKVCGEIIAIFLCNLEEQQELSEEMVEDLQSVSEICFEAPVSSQNLDALECFQRVLLLASQHDPSFKLNYASVFDNVARLIVEGDESAVQKLVGTISATFDEPAIFKALSRPEFIESIIGRWASLRGKPCEITWKYLVPWIAKGHETGPLYMRLVTETLRVLNSLTATGLQEPMPEAVGIISSIIAFADANPSIKTAVVEALKICRTRNSNGFRWLYYELVKGHSLEERQLFRDELTIGNPALSPSYLVDIEIDGDFRPECWEAFIPNLENWMQSGTLEHNLKEEVVSKVFHRYWPNLSLSQQTITAGKLLLSQWFSENASATIIKKLIRTYFMDSRLRILDHDALTLAETYEYHNFLLPAAKAALLGSLSMTKGNFIGTSITDVRNWLTSLDSQGYAKEVRSLVARFFEADINLDSHIEMLQAAYVHQYQKEFWDVYWAEFRSLALNKQGVDKMIDLLSFWFDESLSVFGDQPYLGAAFFLQLPSILEDLAKDKQTSHLIQELDARKISLPWYQLVKPYLPQSLGKTMLSFLRRDR